MASSQDRPPFGRCDLPTNNSTFLRLPRLPPRHLTLPFLVPLCHFTSLAVAFSPSPLNGIGLHLPIESRLPNRSRVSHDEHWLSFYFNWRRRKNRARIEGEFKMSSLETPMVCRAKIGSYRFAKSKACEFVEQTALGFASRASFGIARITSTRWRA